MNYIKYSIEVAAEEVAELLIAELSVLDITGFEESGNIVLVYAEEGFAQEEDLKRITGKYNLVCRKDIEAEKNWNEEWERDFKPVIVDDFCTIRAHFHNIPAATVYDIVITPKMSFGTGHHATTQLMIRQMKTVNFNGAGVLDFGTGTGVLAILAEKLGAKDIMAIDIDEWSVENTKENIERNNCTCINTAEGSLEVAGTDLYDVVLANINRNILLEYMPRMTALLRDEGAVLMSGILQEDREIILEAASVAGLLLQSEEELNKWIVLKFKKV